jgi:hypothetical protein
MHTEKQDNNNSGTERTIIFQPVSKSISKKSSDHRAVLYYYYQAPRWPCLLSETETWPSCLPPDQPRHRLLASVESGVQERPRGKKLQDGKRELWTVVGALIRRFYIWGILSISISHTPSRTLLTRAPYISIT